MHETCIFFIQFSAFVIRLCDLCVLVWLSVVGCLLEGSEGAKGLHEGSGGQLECLEGSGGQQEGSKCQPEG